MFTIRQCLICKKDFRTYPSEIKKGKGKYCSRKCCLKVTGIKPGQRLSPDTEFKKGSENKNWKGDEVGYANLHKWVVREKGRAKKCTLCGNEKSRIEWANKSHDYKRDLDDWMELCSPCHRAYDVQNGWGVASKKYPETRRYK